MVKFYFCKNVNFVKITVFLEKAQRRCSSWNSEISGFGQKRPFSEIDTQRNRRSRFFTFLFLKKVHFFRERHNLGDFLLFFCSLFQQKFPCIFRHFPIFQQKNYEKNKKSELFFGERQCAYTFFSRKFFKKNKNKKSVKNGCAKK